MKNDKLQIIIFTILFVVVAINALLISFNSISGYGISLYSGLTLFSWISIILTIIIGVFLTLINYNNKDNKWILGLGLILLINLILLLLASSQGYVINSGGDVLSHLGYSIDILNTSHIGNLNFYPVTHILIVSFSYLSNIPIINLINYIGPLFYLLFVLYSYLLVKLIFNKNAAILAALSSTVLILPTYYALFPMGLAFLTFPLVFYLYFSYSQNKKPATAMIIILMLIFIALLHPVASFLLFLSLVIFELIKILNNYSFKQRKIVKNNENSYQISFILAAISIIVLLAWLWSFFDVWSQFIYSIIDLFTSQLSTISFTTQASESILKLGLSNLGLLELIIKIYGHLFILWIISFISAVLFLTKKNFYKENNIEVFSISILFILFSILAGTDFIHPLTSLSSGRLLNAVVPLFPILLGGSFYVFLQKNQFNNKIKNKKNENKTRTTIIGLIIISSIIIGIFALYPSPLIYQTNDAIDNQNLNGGYWLINYGNLNYEVINLYTDPINRYADALLGSNGAEQKGYPQQLRNYVFPDHFNYTTDYGNSFSRNTYLLTEENNIVYIYKYLYPQLHRFDANDFNRLENDSSVNKIYDDGEIQNWLINGQNH